MSKSLCLIVLCTLASTALATIDFFFTISTDPYGLKYPSLAFKHSFNDGYDFNRGYELSSTGGVYNVPPYGSLGDLTIDISDPNAPFVYVWARFNNEPPPSQIGALNSILIKINGAYTGGGFENNKIAFYQLDNRYINPPANMKWDGGWETLYNNPCPLIAITATGQRNVPQDQPYNLYVGGTDRVFLLGAARAIALGEMTIDVPAICYSGTPSNPMPPCPLPRYLNKVIVIPEPAGLMLLAVAGLVLRRR